MRFDSVRALFRSPPAYGAPEPDFICAGMEKAASSWIYDQLQAHPDFWMPPVKELRYLDMAAPPITDAVRMAFAPKDDRLGPQERASRAFLEEACALAGRRWDLEKYGALFRHKGPRLCGDISPSYRRLKAQRIAEIAQRFPKLRVFLMVRDPVERAWSHISMQHRLGRFDPALLDDPRCFATWFARSPVKRASFASAVPARWAAAAPAIPFRAFFFDDVAERPEAARSAIIAFLGGNPLRKSGKLAPGYNRKSGTARLRLGDPIRAVLVEQLAQELDDCARVFGGPAKDWPSRYGL